MSTPNDGGLTLPKDSDGNAFLGLWDGARFWAPRADNQRSLKAALYGPDGNPLARGRDSVPGTGDMGVVWLAVRKDTPGSLASADGHYTALQVGSTGALRVNPEALDFTIDGVSAREDLTGYSNGLVLASPATASQAYSSLTASAAEQATALVSAITSKSIRVIALTLCNTGTSTVYITLGTKTGASAATALKGVWSATAGQTLPLSLNKNGWGQTAAGDALVVFANSGTSGGSCVVFVEYVPL